MFLPLWLQDNVMLQANMFVTYAVTDNQLFLAHYINCGTIIINFSHTENI